jgi:hypothetical protein
VVVSGCAAQASAHNASHQASPMPLRPLPRLRSSPSRALLILLRARASNARASSHPSPRYRHSSTCCDSLPLSNLSLPSTYLKSPGRPLSLGTSLSSTSEKRRVSTRPHSCCLALVRLKPTLGIPCHPLHIDLKTRHPIDSFFRTLHTRPPPLPSILLSTRARRGPACAGPASVALCPCRAQARPSSAHLSPPFFFTSLPHLDNAASHA